MLTNALTRFRRHLGGRLPLNLRNWALPQYVSAAPSPQHAVDLFTGEWTSRFPSGSPAVSGGTVPLFEDERVAWAIDRFGGVRDKTVLELGPLEGGHSYMLERAGARSVDAIEANARAYLRCLVVKELFGLQQVHFALGDFLRYLQSTTAQYDACLASGVLYHMTEPVELIRLISGHARQVFCWTHYYDANLLRGNARTARLVVEGLPTSVAGFTCNLYPYVYGNVRITPSFCGAALPTARWMERHDIERAFKHFGFRSFETAFDQPDHINGPALSFVATK
jgi:hypothetical protein